MIVPTYYLTQTSFSRPGPHAALYDDLPDDLDGLCRTVRGIYRHYFVEPRPAKSRMGEVDLRYVAAILERATTLDARPLTAERPLARRVVGCCRDASLLLVSMLRHKGIPARPRAGFATYFDLGVPGMNVDHVVAEIWDDGRWKLVDPELDDALKAENGIDFDVHDIPRDRFLVGGAAWQICRVGKADPDLFCGGPDDIFKGMWAIRARMMNDLAMLNRVELLLWDSYGWMDMRFEPDAAQTKVLDDVAAATARGDEDAAHALYAANPPLQAAAQVMCYSPAARWQMVKPRYS